MTKHADLKAFQAVSMAGLPEKIVMFLCAIIINVIDRL